MEQERMHVHMSRLIINLICWTKLCIDFQWPWFFCYVYIFCYVWKFYELSALTLVWIEHRQLASTHSLRRAHGKTGNWKLKRTRKRTAETEIPKQLSRCVTLSLRV